MNHGWSKKRDTPERKESRRSLVEAMKEKYADNHKLDAAIYSMADGMAEHLVKK